MGFRAQLGQQLNSVFAVHQFENIAMRVIQVAEDARLLMAGGHAVGVFACRNPIHAKIAFLHRTGSRVGMARPVGTCHHTCFATDTFFDVNPNNAIGALLRSPSRATIDARGIFTMHAHQRQVDHVNIRKHAGGADGCHRVINHIDRQVIIDPAGHCARMATNTTAGIEDKCVTSHRSLLPIGWIDFVNFAQ